MKKTLYVVVFSIIPALLLPTSSLAANSGEAVRNAINRVTPALIRIQVVEARYENGQEIKGETSGSGVIISPEGYAVTNHHVAGDATRMFVTLFNKEELPARLVGSDPLSDIAVIKVEGKPGQVFPTAQFGDSSKVKIGDRVFALGSPIALSQSVTAGIVSNVEMIMPNFLWPYNKLTLAGEDVGSMVRWIGHDARISGGNSGGPLIDENGLIIGINEIHIGLAGAIPGNLAKSVVSQLMQNGKVTRSWLGLDVQPLLRSLKMNEGVLVSGVIDNSPASKAGVKSGDIILKMNGQPVTVRFGEEVPLFNQFIAELPVKSTVELTVMRQGKQIIVPVVTEEREQALPKEVEFPAWGMTGRNISSMIAKEMERESRDGVLVTSTSKSGPVSDAKPPIKDNDIIVRVAGQAINNVSQLALVTKGWLSAKQTRRPTLVEFERKGERYLTVVKLGKDPLNDPGLEAVKAWIPVKTQVLTADLAEALGLSGYKGMRVTQVFRGKSAEKAGLRVGDIITAIDGEPIEAEQPGDFEIFNAMIREKNIGEKAELDILRNKKPMKISLELESSPKLPREMKRYRDDDFQFTCRNLTFDDTKTKTKDRTVTGVYIEIVDEGGWAGLARLAVGDIVTEVNGKTVANVQEMEKELKSIKTDKPETVVFHLQRGIRQLYIEILPVWAVK